MMWFTVSYDACVEKIKCVLNWNALPYQKWFSHALCCGFFLSVFLKRTLSAWACRHCQDSCLWWDSKVHSNTEQMVPFPSHHLLSAQNRMGGVSCWGITSKVLQACFVWAWGSGVLVTPSGGSALTVPTKAQAPAPQMALQGPGGSNTLQIGRIRMDCFLQAGISFTE